MLMIVETAINNARAYAARQQLRLAERLGFGIHGTVFATEGNSKGGNTALKAHHSAEPYLRERQIYQRLREAGVTQILGFRVPSVGRLR
jgi:hypothetical protein